jgi:hypothetical protein
MYAFRYRSRFVVGVLFALLLVFASGCHDGDELEPIVLDSPPLDPDRPRVGSAVAVGGDWDVMVSETLDTCGIDLPADARLNLGIGQRGLHLDVSVSDGSTPCGTYGFDLHSTTAVFGRTLNVQDVSSDCRIRVETSVSMTFTLSTFVATEQNHLVYLSGDCGSLTDPCDWNLQASGARCSSCAPACSGSLPAGQDRLGGPFGFAAQIDVLVP